MASTTSPAVEQPTLEDKLTLAAAQSETIVEAFSPQVAELIKTGVAVEPVLSGIAHMIAGLFKHHTSK